MLGSTVFPLVGRLLSSPPLRSPQTCANLVAFVHTAASLSQQTQASTSSSPKSRSTSKIEERVYDYKPVLPSHQKVFTPVHNTSAAATKWTPSSRRVGVLALKAGMTGDFDQWGVRRALTALKLEDVIVTGVIREEERGYNALQIGCTIPKIHKINKPLLGYFEHQGVSPRMHLSEFHVTPDAFLPVGTPLDVRHYIPGEYINITGISQGKGFQGGMKRHNFAGQNATHGNSVSHRALGATGCRQDPGKVAKGKKMPGHLGADTVTVQSLRIYKIDIKRNIVYVEGAVPGKAGTILRVVDAPKRPFKAAPPFPTYVLTDSDRELSAKWAREDTYLSPMEEAIRAAAGTLPQGYEREPAYEWVAAPPTVDPFSIPENDEAEEV